MGPQGVLLEVTAEGEQVWRYVSPVRIEDGAVCVVRQGDHRTGGRFSLFRAVRYEASDARLVRCASGLKQQTTCKFANLLAGEQICHRSVLIDLYYVWC